jgi:tRNA(adenine34) deaminase
MNHEHWMQIAISEAELAFTEDEIPVGAVLVRGDELILRDHNRTNQLNNPLAHAELLILTEVQKSEKYLHDYTLYVTLEPCLMCSGAIILSRVGTLVYGCRDPKTGVVGSVYNVMTDKHFNHHPIVVPEILADKCSQLLRDFFRKKR